MPQCRLTVMGSLLKSTWASNSFFHCEISSSGTAIKVAADLTLSRMVADVLLCFLVGRCELAELAGSAWSSSSSSLSSSSASSPFLPNPSTTPCIRSITRINDSTVIHPLLWQPTYLPIRGYDCKDMPRTEGCTCRCAQRYCQGRVCNLMQINNPFYLPLHAQAAHNQYVWQRPQKYHLPIRAVSKLYNSSQTWRNLWANPRGRLPDFCKHVIYVLWSPNSAGRLYLVVEHYW